ncbi:hypothetical protein CMO92_01135 [Candidatus Woesearchaeota archaeon]|nr:hypothetical protein [Candidatus Woesearchaeota archaeon]
MKPGEKFSTASARLRAKGGLRAFFAPGVGFEDFNEGVFCKYLLVVEPDSGLRREILSSFEESVFDCYGAGTFEDAKRVLDVDRKLDYLVVADRFPQSRGGVPEALADRLVVHAREHSPIERPNLRCFGFVESESGLSVPYRGIIRKGESGVRDLYDMLIADSEGGAD